MTLIITSKDPWPADGIDAYSRIEDGQWGYLVQYNDGRLIFIEERPTDAEILDRWGFWLDQSSGADRI